MSFPGRGLKKPLNSLNNPVYPDIRKALPRFQWSGKHWKVDEASALLSPEALHIAADHVILAQSRNYNKEIYGQSSHRDIVNGEFRPPIQDQYADFGPLTRIPVTSRTIIGRVNPGTTGHGNGTNLYTPNNQSITGISSYLTDRVSTGNLSSSDCPVMGAETYEHMTSSVPDVSDHITLVDGLQPREHFKHTRQSGGVDTNLIVDGFTQQNAQPLSNRKTPTVVLSGMKKPRTPSIYYNSGRNYAITPQPHFVQPKLSGKLRSEKMQIKRGTLHQYAR